MDNLLKVAREVAEKAVRTAGETAREYFHKEKHIEEKGDDGDLVTLVDHLAEKQILQLIRAEFPDHQIRSEETGWSGTEGDWLWLVDPLDGTNNYAIGLPVYGVSVTLLYRREPVLGAIYDSHLGKLYVAERDKGAFCDGRRLSVRADGTPGKLTVGWIQGHVVQKDAAALRLKHHLDSACKRVLRLWAPSLLWCMLARGDLHGIVLYNSEGDDLYAGVLMAREVGALVMDFAGQPFTGMHPEPYIIACHPIHREHFLGMVGQAMK